MKQKSTICLGITLHFPFFLEPTMKSEKDTAASRSYRKNCHTMFNKTKVIGILNWENSFKRALNLSVLFSIEILQNSAQTSLADGSTISWHLGSNNVESISVNEMSSFNLIYLIINYFADSTNDSCNFRILKTLWICGKYCQLISFIFLLFTAISVRAKAAHRCWGTSADYT